MKTKTILTLAVVLLLGLYPTAGHCQTPSGNARQEKAQSHKLAADRHLREGRTSAAIAEYQKALETDSSCAAACFNLAIAHRYERNNQGAAGALEKLVKLDPKDVEAYYNLGCLALYRGEFEKARCYFLAGKPHCELRPKFEPLIEDALGFIEAVETLDPHTKSAVLLLLQHYAFS